jgi:hypothetical protein
MYVGNILVVELVAGGELNAAIHRAFATQQGIQK